MAQLFAAIEMEITEQKLHHPKITCPFLGGSLHFHPLL